MITVFGETELMELQEDGKTENKQVAQAYLRKRSERGRIQEL